MIKSPPSFNVDGSDARRDDGPPRRGLIADDLAVNRRLLAALFRADGFDPLVVGSGPAAVEAVQATPPSVVVLDLQMPGKTARLLKVDFKTLQNKMRRLGLGSNREDDGA